MWVLGDNFTKLAHSLAESKGLCTLGFTEDLHMSELPGNPPGHSPLLIFPVGHSKNVVSPSTTRAMGAVLPHLSSCSTDVTALQWLFMHLGPWALLSIWATALQFWH